MIAVLIAGGISRTTRDDRSPIRIVRDSLTRTVVGNRTFKRIERAIILRETRRGVRLIDSDRRRFIMQSLRYAIRFRRRRPGD
jgi:hypothetical protein